MQLFLSRFRYVRIAVTFYSGFESNEQISARKIFLDLSFSSVLKLLLLLKIVTLWECAKNSGVCKILGENEYLCCP